MTEVGQYCATCFHEAAHAVFALDGCGFSLQYVSAGESYCAVRSPLSVGYADYWRSAMLMPQSPYGRLGALTRFLVLSVSTYTCAEDLFGQRVFWNACSATGPAARGTLANG